MMVFLAKAALAAMLILFIFCCFYVMAMLITGHS